MKAVPADGLGGSRSGKVLATMGGLGGLCNSGSQVMNDEEEEGRTGRSQQEEVRRPSFHRGSRASGNRCSSTNPAMGRSCERERERSEAPEMLQREGERAAGKKRGDEELHKAGAMR